MCDMRVFIFFFFATDALKIVCQSSPNFTVLVKIETPHNCVRKMQQWITMQFKLQMISFLGNPATLWDDFLVMFHLNSSSSIHKFWEFQEGFNHCKCLQELHDWEADHFSACFESLKKLVKCQSVGPCFPPVSKDVKMFQESLQSLHGLWRCFKSCCTCNWNILSSWLGLANLAGRQTTLIWSGQLASQLAG